VPLYVYALILHGVLGGADVIINHELLARIPSRPNAGPEERMHAARELLFAAIFLSLWCRRATW
jgi:hypothetical protein